MAGTVDLKTTHSPAGALGSHSEAIAYNVIALPIYNDMTDAEADGIVRAFVDVHRESKRIAQALG